MPELTIITFKKTIFKAMGTLRELALILLSARHCILLKVYFAFKRPRDYVDGLLSLIYIPDKVVDMTHCDEPRNKYRKRRCKVLQ